MGGDNLLGQIGLSESTGPGREAVALRRELFQKKLPTLRPFPAVRALLARMRDDGLTRVVATSASGEERTGLLAQAGITDLVQAATTDDDTERSKPEPDIDEAALDRVGVPANEALLLGDTSSDLEAARSAGVGFVAVRSGGWPFPPRKEPVPLAVYDDASHLLEQWARSPFVTLRR